jgi:hypothetical protein
MTAFCKDRFDTLLTTTKKILDHFETLGGSLHGITFTMNGRGVSKSLRESVHLNPMPSAHARLQLNDDFLDLTACLKSLRQEFALASGGLDARYWSKAELFFQSTGFYLRHPLISDIASKQLLAPQDTLSTRLARHATLDLRGPHRLFRVAPRNDSLSPKIIAGPTPEKALLSHMILVGSSLTGWYNPVIQEVLDPTLYDQARALLNAHP